MPKLIDGKFCPHCRAPLPEPKPRACPECAASLNQRFLKLGCLSSAPPLVLVAATLWAVLEALA